ncbi:MAG TPA: hypothetical protein VK728_16605 [Candidatus Sulfotelmatobacter sp.]|nr:hypothetical protein [Candidatus Sulfotelmatobacter sp.]
MIEPKQRKEKSLLGRSRTKAFRLIRTGSALLLFAGAATPFYGQSPEALKSADKKSQLSPQEQSVRRDQVYVRQLLQRGTSEAKVESVLQLSSRFTSFNPTGDFHEYAVSLIAKEKAALKQQKQTQQAGVASQAPVAAVISDISAVPASAIALAPSNSVGINSVKSSQESSRDNSTEAVTTSAPENNQAAVSNSSPAAFGGGIFLPAVSTPSTGGGAAQNTSVGAVSNSNGAAGSGGSSGHQSGSGGSSDGGSNNANTFNSDQGPGPGPIGPGPGCNLFPAPPSVGASVPLTYFGPPPSETNPSLVGPVQLLKSGTVDAAHGTITLPLYLGHMKGSKKNVWYILTDVDDPNVAAELGLNFSAKLTFASNAARTANLATDGTLVFDKGTVDFSPVRSVVPGPAGAEFPPVSVQPGAVGDADYSPFVQVTNAAGVIYNAPIVAFNVDASQINFPDGNVDYTKVHDEVVAIDPNNQTVTLNLINGFSFGRPVWYLSMDASIPLSAAIEHNTFAPLMQQLHLGGDDSFSSPIERIFIATNGAESGGCNNPQRQGLSADLADGHRPNNVLGGIPTIALDYSPAWDAQLFEWTKDAIDNSFRGQVREEFQILTFVQDGLITGPGGIPFGSSGFTINCPIVQRLD